MMDFEGQQAEPNFPILAVQSAPQTSKLFLLIGLPGSGKSFWATKLRQDCPRRRVISTDEIRSRLFGNAATQGTWLKIWRTVGLEFRQAVQQIAQGEVTEAVYDATNAVRRQRRKAIALARQCGFTQITGVWINPPVELCLERNQRRDRTVPLAVILKMHRSLTAAPPALPEGLDDLIEVGSESQTIDLWRTERDRLDDLLT
jgi:predicted kinase